ncbi:hypothetical protein LTR95_006103 [Oleoguttula sp. CCFEE 5521]|uniref:Uncharacterized protein n=1 Tax=Cryoendolithus antarcticus TaxID=1507870 RepID=A0A1V8S9C7_9PEZI|nr:hypothetical protein B0A48_18639 [Cryoendolithus antarcticus]
MPTTMRRHLNRTSSESDPASTEFALGAPGVRSEDRDSLENDDNGEHIPATLPGIIRQLMVLQRQMEYNFGDLHNGLRDTNTRLDEGLRDTNIRLDELRAGFDAQRVDLNELRAGFDAQRVDFHEQRAQVGQLKAQQINQRATHINNPNQPVGRDDGTLIPTELSRRYKHVHELVRLKRRDNWQVLAELHSFYSSESWSTWGFNPLSSWDESDIAEPLMTHNTLEDAISWAPDDALQDLVRHLGLDYDKIMTNVEEYESLQQRRATQNKRVAAGEMASSKRGRLRYQSDMKHTYRRKRRWSSQRLQILCQGS